MKIVQISSHYGKGGAGKIVSSLHEEMELDGVKVCSFYGRESGNLQDKKYIVRIGNDWTNKFDALLTRITGLVGYFSIISTRRLIRYLEEEKPDLIHLHVVHGYYLNLRILLKYLCKSKIPTVWTFHDCYAFTGKCGYSFDCEKYKDKCGRCPYLHDYPNTLFFDCTRKMRSDKERWLSGIKNLAVVSPCDWMTELVRESIFNRFDCLTINNGIETNTIFKYKNKIAVREVLHLPTDRPVALGVAYGQGDPRKGVRYIVEAAKHLEYISFVLIGVSEKDESLYSQIPNIITKGFISNPKLLVDYYNSADVYLLPSLAENYATTVIESQACGTPVVGFDVGGVPEQLYGLYGTYVIAGDQIAFEAEIERYCLNPYNDDNRIKLAAMVHERNSCHNMYLKYKEVYSNLISR